MCNYEFNGILFEWDEAKERPNIEKHGIDFKTAASVWGDRFAMSREDIDHSWDEFRVIRIGTSIDSRLPMVVHCYRDEKGTIRITSARKCTKREGPLMASSEGWHKVDDVVFFEVTTSPDLESMKWLRREADRTGLSVERVATAFLRKACADKSMLQMHDREGFEG